MALSHFVLVEILLVLSPEDVGVQLREPSSTFSRHLEMPNCRCNLG